MVDPLSLDPLFDGGGEPWLPLLKPTLERQSDAATFIGPARDKSIVPVRELTFQALKPNPPETCTVKLAVAKGFLGGKGRRTLFEVVSKSAVSIRALSAFTGEEELVLLPGTRLTVANVTHAADGLTTVRLEESDGARLVA